MTLFNEDHKIFRDSVHGYISIPKDFCHHFIDTGLFQRLRHIEQTSMRVLYPSARHDRFAHSLGTYHLGKRFFEYLQRNTQKKILSGIKPDTWCKYEKTFQIACLLHDCAHAPFSHTTEKFYDLGPEKTLDDTLIALFEQHGGDPNFQDDFEEGQIKNVHEKVSAIILLQMYHESIQKLGADPLLAARMIIGCKYRVKENINKQFKNCLIDLLNGRAIDVDKLDYTLRDTWASGINNISIDIERLLASITVAEIPGKGLVIAFKKSGCSVIQNVVDARNYLFQWIYVQHKVLYDQRLLQESISETAKVIGSNDDSDDVLRRIFSLDAFHKPVEIGAHSFFLPTDGDLIQLIKQYSDQVPAAKEWLERKHCRTALWKTYPEYKQLFARFPDQGKIGRIQKNAQKGLNEKFKNDNDTNFWVEDVTPKIATIQANELYLLINEEPISFSMCFDTKVAIQKYFFVYAPKECLPQKKEILKHLFSLAS